jgi:hypothetical protein
MHARLGSRILIVLGFVAAFAAPRRAHAQVTDAADCPTTLPACTVTRTNCCTAGNPAGATGGILIPLNRCVQQVVYNGYDVSADNKSPTWCEPPKALSHGDGMMEAFGLAYRMMQYTALHQSTPIYFYWIVNPTKAPSRNGADSGGKDTWTEKDIDMWILPSGASPPKSGANLSSLGASTAPITLMKNDASNNIVADTAYAYKEFPVRGSAFYIPPAYAANFATFWKYRSGRTGCHASGQDCYDFTDVAIYQVDANAHFAWQDFSKATSGGYYVLNDNQMPVAMRVDYPPPKIAAIYSGNDMTNWLQISGLKDFATNSSTCPGGTAFTPSDAVECTLSDSDVDNNKLVTGGFTWAWFEDTGTSCTEAPKVNTFLTGVNGSYSAGNVFVFNGSISNMAEGCTTNNFLGDTTVGLGAANSNTKEPIVVPFPANLLAQFGDLPLNFASGSVTQWAAVKTTGGTRYNSLFTSGTYTTLRRLMTMENSSGTNCTNHDDLMVNSPASAAGCYNTATTATAGTPDGDYQDVFAYGRYGNNVNNGIVFYAPGQNISQNGEAAQLRMVLSALIATPPLRAELNPSKVEIARSSPVPALVNGFAAMVQGSFEYQYVTYNIGGTNVNYQVPRQYPQIFSHDDVGAFTFPWPRGHMRAIKDTGLTTTATAFSSESANFVFDAASNLPSATFTGCSGPPFAIGCRNIFTNDNDWTTSTAATRVMFDESHVATAIKNSDGTANTLGGLILASVTGDTTAGALLADQKLLIDRVLAGDNSSGTYLPALGGVDRSTVAVIGSSGVISGSRPTIAYFGATDGMLHAVCADNSTGVCNGKLGTELWAFLPRVSLSNLRSNSARIDGSPRVVDAYGNFSTCTAKPCYRTVLTLATGTGDATSTISAQPAVYALDISDPTDPKVLWEYTTPTTRTAYEMGSGLSIAQGDIVISSTDTNLTMIESNNGGTGSNGVVVTAIQTDTGAKNWQFAYPYPAQRTGSDVALSSSGMPGGAVTIDKTDKGGNTSMSDITFGDLYGDLWELNPANGQSRYNASGTYYLGGVASTGKPMFSFSTDYHPIGAKPAIYNNGNVMYAVIVDGGYADSTDTAVWGVNASQHYALGINLNAPNADATFDENKGPSDVAFKLSLGAGELGYSQATVVGNELFFTTDTTDVNSATYGTGAATTGHAYGYNIATSTAATAIAIQNGASSIANSGTSLYESSGGQNQKLSTTALGTTGPTVTASPLTSIARKLWIRTQ